MGSWAKDMWRPTCGPSFGATHNRVTKKDSNCRTAQVLFREESSGSSGSHAPHDNTRVPRFIFQTVSRPNSMSKNLVLERVLKLKSLQELLYDLYARLCANGWDSFWFVFI